MVPTTPALAPLVLDAAGRRAPSTALCRASRWASGWTFASAARVARRVAGSLLWTHFGVSGPAALDASRHWLRARLDGPRRWPSPPVFVHGRFRVAGGGVAGARARHAPGCRCRRRSPAWCRRRSRPRLLQRLAIDGAQTLAGSDARHAARADARRCSTGRSPSVDSRGYNYAEVTAGGVPLTEIDPALDAVARLPGPVPGRRDARRRRPARRLQLPVGVVHGPDRRRGAG